MKFTSNWQAAMLALAVAGVVGCDPVAESNKDVLNKLVAGDTKLAKANNYKPTDAVTAAHADLAAAANDKDADPGYQAIAAAAVAGVDQGVADTSAAGFYDSILHAREILGQMQSVTNAIAYAANLADGAQKSDPKAVVGKMTTAIHDMQGSADKATWGPEGSQLPTLAAVKQEISRLQGDIAAQQQKLADLAKQRSNLIETAEAQLKHADSLKGDDAVRAFADGSDSRRKADDVAIQIDIENSKLTRDQADLALQQGQETSLNAGITLLQGQIDQINKAWTDTQQRAESQRKIVTAAIDGDEQNKLTLKGLSADLAKALADVTEQRKAATDGYSEAEKYYGTAHQQAQTLSQSFAEKLATPGPNTANYTKLRDAMQPQQYQLQIGIVRRDAATVIAAEAKLLADVSSAKTQIGSILTAAGQQLPTELASFDPASAKTLADEADSRFNDAAGDFANVEGGNTQKPTLNAAKIAHLITLNARIQLAGVKTELGDSSAAAVVSQMTSDAKALRDDIVSAGLQLPHLPGELGKAPAAPTPDAPAAPTAPTAPAAPAGAPATPPNG